MKNRKVLVIAAHPDDEVLGCGGTIVCLAKEGCKIYTLILGEGITSRDYKRDIKKRGDKIEKLKIQAKEANRILGVEKVFFANFPDNRFDTVPILDVVKTIEKIKNKVKPDIIFTHYEKDLNIDHQITYESVLTATRPMMEESVREIYSFEVLSSTEWNYPLSFSPNVFYDIKDAIDMKVEAMKMYKSELKKYYHPRDVPPKNCTTCNWSDSMVKHQNKEVFYAGEKIYRGEDHRGFAGS